MRRQKQFVIACILSLLVYGAIWSSCTLSFVCRHVLSSTARFFNMPTDSGVYGNPALGVVRYRREHYAYLRNDAVDECHRFTPPPLLLVFVKTLPAHFEQREAIRETWGGKGVELGAVVLFMMGATVAGDHDDQLRTESVHHRDIVQEDFREHFHNLTVKLMAQFAWTLTHCARARYFMTTDDDVYVNLANVVAYLRSAPQRALFVGHVHRGSPPDRCRRSKYGVPASVYRGLYYPDYCPGAGYVLSVDVVARMYAERNATPMLYIDDAYAGILAHAAGVAPVHHRWFLGEHKSAGDCDSLRRFFTSHGYTPSTMRDLHATVVRARETDTGFFCRNF